MKPRRPGGFRSLGRASGAALGRIAVRVYVCRGCGVQHKGVKVGDKVRPPLQCLGCGRMDFDSFDSTGEAGHWAELLIKERVGLISDLRRQVRFDLMTVDENGRPKKVAQYVADYVFVRDGKLTIRDYKGAITDVAALKLRWMAAMGMPVEIVTAKGVQRA